MKIRIERIYGSVVRDGEYRVLVDRLWPRGISKEDARLDIWAKEVAPSAELRGWFGHIPERFAEFRTRYVSELKKNPAAAELLKQLSAHPGNIVLLYGAKDEQHNQAVVLKDYLVSHS